MVVVVVVVVTFGDPSDADAVLFESDMSSTLEPI